METDTTENTGIPKAMGPRKKPTFDISMELLPNVIAICAQLPPAAGLLSA